MRTRMACWIVVLVVVAGFAVFSLGRGQDSLAPAPPKSPVSDPLNSDSGGKGADAAPARPSHDLSKLPLLQRQMYFSTQRGADWLFHANRADGRFVNGYVPDLKTVLEGDHYLRQVGATMALARAARFLGDDHYAAVARQGVLTLLLDTAPDPNDSRVRSTTLPSAIVDPLGAAGLLVLAINELPSPGDDLLEQSEQLCAFIARQQQPDGSLTAGGNKLPVNDPEGINPYPGQALYGLMRSQQYRPAPWKTEVVRKALAYYQPWWREHKSMALVSWLTAAYTEAYLLTKQQPFADAVNEMTDWICGLQYVEIDPHHPLWTGGFMTWVDGRAATMAPQVTGASCAETLAEACRVARQAGDRQRYQRYGESLQRSLQFLLTLQYTDANTKHFADWYRPILVGGFYASHQDGNLRIDYSQHAVCALVQYLSYVVEVQ